MSCYKAAGCYAASDLPLHHPEVGGFSKKTKQNTVTDEEGGGRGGGQKQSNDAPVRLAVLHWT